MKRRDNGYKHKRRDPLWLAGQAALVLLGFALIYNTTYVISRSSYSLATYLPAMLGGWFIFLGLGAKLLRRLRKNPVLLALSNLFRLGVFLYLLSVLLLYSYSNLVRNVKSYDPDILIVLGGGLKGSLPSLTLRNRLDEAVDYLEKNPEALLLVTGAQGPMEERSEAVAMWEYLVKEGVPSDKILLEEKATSTRENFLYSKELIASIWGITEPKIAFATTDFHILRSGLLARWAGFDNPVPITAGGVSYQTLGNYMREVLALYKDLILQIPEVF